jgi:PIN domain nuclease of toxin-antitoxin system
MKFLIDTHIWLWSQLDVGRLSAPVTQALSDPVSQIWFSPISAWEILALSAKGRVDLAPNAPEWIETSISRAGFREAPLTNEVVMALTRIETPHRDPADRFLAATANSFDLTLVTADQNLIQGRGYNILSAV